MVHYFGVTHNKNMYIISIGHYVPGARHAAYTQSLDFNTQSTFNSYEVLLPMHSLITKK